VVPVTRALNTIRRMVLPDVAKRRQWRDEARAWLREADRSGPLVAIARRTRNRLPGDPGFGDPLSTAGKTSAQSVARLLQTYIAEDRTATREFALGALQVWQSGLERLGKGQGDHPVTIVFTDLVGFSSWALVAGDDETLALLRAVATAIEPRVIAHGGQVVKRTGDGLMAVFPDPLSAFDAIVDGRELLAEIETEDGFRPILRVGIHTGTPRELGGDWLGVDVNVAARLMQHAGAGNIGISGPTLDEIPVERLEELGLVARTTRRILPEHMAGVPHDLPTFVLGPPTSGRQGLLGWLPGER
jgi:adenylate cyclase